MSDTTAAVIKDPFKLLNELVALHRNWMEQDGELAYARMGLQPEDRTNENADNQRIRDRRSKALQAVIAMHFGGTDVESRQQRVFDHFAQNHGLTLTESEMVDIEHVVSQDLCSRITNLINENTSWRVDSQMLERFVEKINASTPGFETAMGSPCDHAELALAHLIEQRDAMAYQLKQVLQAFESVNDPDGKWLQAGPNGEHEEQMVGTDIDEKSAYVFVKNVKLAIPAIKEALK